MSINRMNMLFIAGFLIGCLGGLQLNAALKPSDSKSSLSAESKPSTPPSPVSLQDDDGKAFFSENMEKKELTEDKQAEQQEQQIKAFIADFKANAENAIDEYVTLACKLLEQLKIPLNEKQATQGVLYNKISFIEAIEIIFDQYKGLNQGSTQWRALNEGLIQKEEKTKIDYEYRDVVQKLARNFTKLIIFNKSGKVDEAKSLLFTDDSLFFKKENLTLNHALYNNLIELRQTLIKLFANLKYQLLDATQMKSSYENDINNPFKPSKAHENIAKFVSNKIEEHKKTIQDSLKTTQDDFEIINNRYKRQIEDFENLIDIKSYEHIAAIQGEFKDASPTGKFKMLVKSPKAIRTIMSPSNKQKKLEDLKKSVTEAALKEWNTFTQQKKEEIIQITTAMLTALDAASQSFIDFEVFISKDLDFVRTDLKLNEEMQKRAENLTTKLKETIVETTKEHLTKSAKDFLVEAQQKFLEIKEKITNACKEQGIDLNLI